jgi:hypothetical protein
MSASDQESHRTSHIKGTEHLIVGKHGNPPFATPGEQWDPVSTRRPEDTTSSRMSRMCSWKRNRSAHKPCPGCDVWANEVASESQIALQ